MPIKSIRCRLFFFQVLVVLFGMISLDASAHTIRPAVATLTLDVTSTLNVEIKVNAEALLVGLGPEHTDTDDSPNAAAYNELRASSSTQLNSAFDNFVADFLESLVIETDAGVIDLDFIQIVVPDPGDLELARDSVIELSGEVPSEAKVVVWQWPKKYGSSVVRLGTLGSEALQTAWLQPGQESDPFQIAEVAEPPSTATVVTDYIGLGFTHILPLGLDHILFVVGLFLLSTQLRPLIWQVTAFTLAHTITIGLSIYGKISLPPNPVEILIALSIVYVGIENCLSSELRSWRIALVFGFGLLHGVGFAGVLGEIGLPDEAFLTALISFNLGVEFGQLAVIGLMFVIFGLHRYKGWYRRTIVVPGSLIISCIGLYWVWERALGA